MGTPVVKERSGRSIGDRNISKVKIEVAQKRKKKGKTKKEKGKTKRQEKSVKNGQKNTVLKKMIVNKLYGSISNRLGVKGESDDSKYENNVVTKEKKLPILATQLNMPGRSSKLERRNRDS